MNDPYGQIYTYNHSLLLSKLIIIQLTPQTRAAAITKVKNYHMRAITKITYTHYIIPNLFNMVGFFLKYEFSIFVKMFFF